MVLFIVIFTKCVMVKTDGVWGQCQGRRKVSVIGRIEEADFVGRYGERIEERYPESERG